MILPIGFVRELTGLVMIMNRISINLQNTNVQKCLPCEIDHNLHNLKKF